MQPPLLIFKKVTTVQSISSKNIPLPHDHALYKKVHYFVEKHALILKNGTIIVGLSGGPDSVFLLHALHAIAHLYNIKIIAAHVDHEWRATSGADVLFCQQITSQLHIPFVVGKRSDLQQNIKQNGSRQEMGRKMRRIFFESVAQEYNAHAIALAHHADDQQETFFLRMVRGASLTGLTGIKAQQGMYIHPLLSIDKKTIVEFLDAQQIRYLIDPSNSTDVYLRNRLRNHALPALRTCDVRFDQNFMHTIERLQETELFLEQLAEKEFARICTLNNGNKNLALAEFLHCAPLMKQRIIIKWLIAHKVPFTPSERLIAEIIRFLQQSTQKKHALHTTWFIEKKNGYISINRIP